MDSIITSIWRKLAKPPWITLNWEAGSCLYDSTLFYRIENQKRRRWQTVKFNTCEMYRIDDPHTVRYVANVLQAGLDEVTLNTIDAATGSIDVYRDDD